MSDEYGGIASTVVTILVMSMIGGIALMIIAGSAVFGAVAGGAAGLGVKGYQSYKQRKSLGPWDERGDATGAGLFGDGGLFMGEEVRWQ